MPTKPRCQPTLPCSRHAIPPTAPHTNPQAVAKKWIAAGKRGDIINISSQASLAPLPGHMTYCASKAAVSRAHTHLRPEPKHPKLAPPPTCWNNSEMSAQCHMYWPRFSSLGLLAGHGDKDAGHGAGFSQHQGVCVVVVTVHI